jgi:hypothetical protein
MWCQKETHSQPWRALIASLIVFLCLGGCTSVQPVNLDRNQWWSQLEPFEPIVVYEASGRRVDMTLVSIDDTEVIGMSGGSRVQIPMAEVLRIEAEQIDGLKTTGAVVGTVVLIPVFVLACLAGGCQ